MDESEISVAELDSKQSQEAPNSRAETVPEIPQYQSATDWPVAVTAHIEAGAIETELAEPEPEELPQRCPRQEEEEKEEDDEEAQEKLAEVPKDAASETLCEMALKPDVSVVEPLLLSDPGHVPCPPSRLRIVSGAENDSVFAGFWRQVTPVIDADTDSHTSMEPMNSVARLSGGLARLVRIGRTASDATSGGASVTRFARQARTRARSVSVDDVRSFWHEDPTPLTPHVRSLTVPNFRDLNSERGRHRSALGMNLRRRSYSADA